jgi:hypothetical protein
VVKHLGSLTLLLGLVLLGGAAFVQSTGYPLGHDPGPVGEVVWTGIDDASPEHVTLGVMLEYEYAGEVHRRLVFRKWPGTGLGLGQAQRAEVKEYPLGRHLDVYLPTDPTERPRLEPFEPRAAPHLLGLGCLAILAGLFLRRHRPPPPAQGGGGGCLARVVALLMAVCGALLLALTLRLHNSREKVRAYPRFPGVILSSSLEPVPGNPDRVVFSVKYRYEPYKAAALNKGYEGRRYNWFGDAEVSLGHGQLLLKEYSPGKQVSVIADPKTNMRSALHLGPVTYLELAFVGILMLLPLPLRLRAQRAAARRGAVGPSEPGASAPGSGPPSPVPAPEEHAPPPPGPGPSPGPPAASPGDPPARARGSCGSKLLLLAVAAALGVAVFVGGVGYRASEEIEARRPSTTSGWIDFAAANFRGRPARSRVKSRLETAIRMYGLPKTPKGYEVAVQTLIALRKKQGVPEMDVLDSMIRADAGETGMGFVVVALTTASELAGARP